MHCLFYVILGCDLGILPISKRLMSTEKGGVSTRILRVTGGFVLILPTRKCDVTIVSRHGMLMEWLMRSIVSRSEQNSFQIILRGTTSFGWSKASSRVEKWIMLSRNWLL